MHTYLQIPIFFLVVGVVSAIMVPTGKLGPITPPKPLPLHYNPSAPRSAAPVWENVNEVGSQYTPPVYKYILYDYVQKYGHHTLVARPEDYYNPVPRVKVQQPSVRPSYSKFNSYYSPLQFL